MAGGAILGAVFAATLATAPVPVPRPDSLAMLPEAPPDLSIEEMVCRDPRLRGQPRATIAGHYPGCVIVEPVTVTEIAGIRLSTPAVLDCRTARTFANWVTGVAEPLARSMLGRRVTRLWIMGSYSCRTRNNQSGTRLSEHSVGRAVDIGGMTLGDGTEVTVLHDWGKPGAGDYLREIWKRACGPFSTVLGPESDRFHQDHLHLDTAYRDTNYCR